MEVQKSRLTDPGIMLQFLRGGKAYFTIVSTKTGKRFTYRASKPKGAAPDADTVIFLRALTGPDNNQSYSYFGYIGKDGKFHYGLGKAKLNETAPSVAAFKWCFHHMTSGKPASLKQIEFWHEGRCCCCGRRLTVPESIKSGIGPECAKRYGKRINLSQLTIH